MGAIIQSSDVNLWRELIQAKLDAGGSLTALAQELGYARTSLSLAFRGKYKGSTEKIEKRVIEVLSTVECPYLNESITLTQCATYKERDAPTQNPTQMRHWRKCQSCTLGINKGIQ
jgi:lambda repressor-like predicted transcriptional regulator